MTPATRTLTADDTDEGGTEVVAVAARPRARTAAPKADKVLLDEAATALAKEAAESIAEPGAVGEPVGARMLGERLALHQFASTAKAYPGWLWSVTVARAPRQKVATVCETNLLPGEDALLSPEWLPYSDRLAPGDVGAGDITPFVEADPNLEAGYEAVNDDPTGDEEIDEVAFELGLARARVLSPEGRERAAQRWYEGDHGPTGEVALQAPAPCATCGYYMPLAGALRSVFGACTNEWSPADGGVVSRDFGCGAHSQIDMPAPQSERVDPPVVDDYTVDVSD